MGYGVLYATTYLFHFSFGTEYIGGSEYYALEITLES